MRASVVRLRLNGAKHRSEPEEGFIKVLEVADQTHRAFYSRSEAVLYRSEDISKGSIGPILGDPALLSWDQRGVFLQGWEPGSDEAGKPCQRVQVWLIRPII